MRERLAERGVELLCSHRKGSVRKPTQDGRPFRRSRSRGNVQRTIASLRAFALLAIRNEFYAHVIHGFAMVACLVMAFRRRVDAL